MRKFFLIALIMMCVSIAKAQKTKFVALRILYETQVSDLPNAEPSTSLDLYPAFGVLLNPNVSVSIGAGYKTNNLNDAKKFTVKPGVRYTWRLTPKFGLSLSLGVPYTTQTANGYNTSTQSYDPKMLEKTQTYGASIKPSFLILATKRIALDIGIDAMSFTRTDVSMDGQKVDAKSNNKFRFGLLNGIGVPSLTVFYVFK